MQIELTQGMQAIVDPEDYEWLSKWNWHSHKKTGNKNNDVYVARVKNKRDNFFMHRLIMEKYHGDITGKQIDHINRNQLDNRKENLRVCTRSENLQNREKCKSARSSIYRGVSFNKQMGKWTSYICMNEKTKYLGSFSTQEDAALKYNEAARELYGEFAHLNNIV
jgi:hypothetical protein